jgi:ariadne-1
MTCKQCKHEFCWLCLGDWKKHGSETGGYFSCNIYKPSDKVEDPDEERLKMMQHYCDRYSEHKKGMEKNILRY